MAALTLTAESLQNITVDILTALGTPAQTAETVASSLVGANLVGHDSHGIVRLSEYASFVERGIVIPDATPEIVSSFGAINVIDGRHGWGQTSARFAADVAGDAAEKFGIGAVGLRNCNHVGRIGEYAEQLAERGLATMMFCNADPCVAPFGGRERMLGTNPLAMGVPVVGDSPVILDFATAATAEGKLRVARAAGKQVELGAVIDSDGVPSTEPSAFYDGGALLPFGGHKGYGLSVFIELLGGALSGNHPSVTDRYEIGNGVVIIAINPAAFGNDDFAADVSETIATLRASRPIDPARPVLIPGDVEAAQRAARATEIPVDAAIWDAVTALRDRLTA